MSLRHVRTVCIVLLSALLLCAVHGAQAQSQLTVTVNDIQAAPIPGETAYQVTAYTSVVDDSGQPVADLTAADFEVREDGNPVELVSAEVARRPASVVLVIDTSGSMQGQGKMEAARQAAAAFIEGMGQDDQAAVIYFNTEVVVAQNLSADLQAARSIVSLLEAVPNSGTCLYDAAYTAVSAATASPGGQRAVVLLTDGIDERPDRSGPCSSRTLDDVVTLATGPTTRVPIYTLGVGSTVNAADLERIAARTGGDSLIAAGSEGVAALFEAAANQIRTQYAVVYRSATTAGQHNLTVTASHGGVVGIGTRDFITPPLVALSGLDSGAILEGTQVIRATARGDAAILRVVFTLDGQPLAEVTAEPYEVALDSAALTPGTHELAATATLEDGSERIVALSFEVAAPMPTPEPTAPVPTAEPTATPAPEEPKVPVWVIPAGVGGGVLALAGIVILLLLLGRSKRRKTRRGFAGGGDRTIDIQFEERLATLTVEQSPSLTAGQVLDITKPITKIGRGPHNDIVVPDGPVSRDHAEIHKEGSTFRVYDLESTYGTFVNENRVGQGGLLIRHGDQLRLGTRTVLLFSAPLAGTAAQDAPTMDELRYDTSDDGATRAD